MDTGFLDAALLVESQDDYGVELLGPTRLDYHWQARAGPALTPSTSRSIGPSNTATCPAGKTSTSWTPAVDNRGNAVIKVKFSTKDCRRCEPRRAVYTIEEALSATNAHHPARAAISGPPGGPAMGSDRRVSGGVRPPCRDRRHHLARHTEYTSTTHSLHRAGAGPFGTYPDGSGAECAQARRVVAGDRARQDSHHAIRPADGGWRRRITRCDFASSIAFGEMGRAYRFSGPPP